MFLRPAKPDDAAGISAAHARAWNETYRGMMPDAFLDAFVNEPRLDAWRARLMQPAARTATWVAVNADDTVLGFATSGPAREVALTTDGEIYAINLVMQATRHGLGTRLMQAMADMLIENAFDSAGLWVLERNVGARWFYERLGGTIAARHERDFGGTTLVELGYVWRDVGALKRAAAQVLAS